MFTDSAGRTISRESFKADMPATVFYTQTGTGMIATKVVVREAPPVFTAGTITEVSPGILVIEMPGASSTPVRYVDNKTTNYVDQTGKSVRPDMIKPGTPAKIFYTKVGDTLVASKVEVISKDDNPGLPKPPLPEDPANTTTTTTTIKREVKP